jgi:hypothetical protein
VRAAAVRRIFESMVDLSDHGDVMTTFLALPYLRAFNVRRAERGHWPMYSNPARRHVGPHREVPHLQHAAVTSVPSIAEEQRP